MLRCEFADDNPDKLIVEGISYSDNLRVTISGRDIEYHIDICPAKIRKLCDILTEFLKV